MSSLRRHLRRPNCTATSEANHATALSGGSESPSSNLVSTNYVNTISRTQGGTITGTVVWTPGSPAQPYVVNSVDLTINAGATLLLQPGTEVRFGSGRALVVNGSLRVQGSAAAPARLTSSAASPSSGSWIGIQVRAGASPVQIDVALIEWARRGLESTGIAVTLRNSTIRNFSDYGVFLNGSSTPASVLSGNVIDNLNDGSTCIYLVTNSPNLTGNRIQNCRYGLYSERASSPTLTGNNILTSNVWESWPRESAQCGRWIFCLMRR
ncbi:MAG: right-handed parallel beta-helix repeat-containing protein [Panacagrimonas sp.]